MRENSITKRDGKVKRILPQRTSAFAEASADRQTADYGKYGVILPGLILIWLFSLSYTPAVLRPQDAGALFSVSSPQTSRQLPPSAGCEINPPGKQGVDNINFVAPDQADGEGQGGHSRPPVILSTLPPQTDGRAIIPTAHPCSFNHGLSRICTDKVPDWLDGLIEKIHQVEASGRLHPRDGDNGEAVGPLQIHKDVIIDVNRYFNANYSFDDRRDFQKSKEIARLYVSYWMYRHREEIAARIFNGGPRGWQKQGTDEYWERIQNTEYRRQEAGDRRQNEWLR